MKKEKTFEFWNKNKNYYEVLNDENKPLDADSGLRNLLKNIKNNMKILDIGCGTGSKLADANKRRKNLQCYGIDVSNIGIRKGQKINKHIKFKVGNIENLPYKSNTFDCVFSTYVFEHTQNPQKILNEMIRITKKGGKVIIVCPNFGSPLYASPITPLLKHGIRCLIRDFKAIFKKPKKIDWYPETPQLDEGWKPDYDTTILPYIYTLKVLYPKSISSSSWNGNPAGGNIILKIIRMPFKILGLLKIYPFKYWGPILYFEYKK